MRLPRTKVGGVSVGRDALQQWRLISGLGKYIRGYQRRDEGRLRPLPRLDKADYRHCRHRQHHVPEDHLVRAQAALRPRDPRTLLKK